MSAQNDLCTCDSGKPCSIECELCSGYKLMYDKVDGLLENGELKLSTYSQVELEKLLGMAIDVASNFLHIGQNSTNSVTVMGNNMVWRVYGKSFCPVKPRPKYSVAFVASLLGKS